MIVKLIDLVEFGKSFPLEENKNITDRLFGQQMIPQPKDEAECW